MSKVCYGVETDESAPEPTISDDLNDDQFNLAYDPYAMADLSYWCKMPYWTSAELTFLSCGYDPRKLGQMTPLDRSHEPALWDYLERRHMLIVRFISAGHLFDRITPMEGVMFLSDIQEPVIDPLLDFCHQQGYKRTNWRALYRTQTTELNEAKKQIAALQRQVQEIAEDSSHEAGALWNKLQKTQDILLGLAMYQYAYDPKALRSGVPKQISEDCAHENVSVSDDTIRNNLREAAERLEADPDFGKR